MDRVVQEIPHPKKGEKVKVPWYNRNYVIDPSVQLKIVLFLGSIALAAASGICLIAYERMLELGNLFNTTVVPPAALPAAFKEIADSLMYRLAAMVTVMIILFCLAGILLTHRVAGPIWKLQVELRRFFDGEDIKRIAFRKRDEFQDLPKLINKLIDGYKGPRKG